MAPDERLSDHVYTYDAEEKTIVRADRMEEKKREREAEKPEQKAEEKSKEKTKAAPDKAEQADGRVSFKGKLAEKKDIVKAKDEAKKDAPKLEVPKKKVEEIA